MNQKNILLISQVIFPNQCPRSHRTTELAKELARQGHKVVLYASLGNYNYTNFESEYGLKVNDFGKLYFEKTTSDNSRKQTLFDKILGRLFGKVFYFPAIELMWKIPKALKYENNYDLLISIAIPFSIHFGCARAVNKNRKLTKTWIADCGDPFMGNKFLNYPFYFKYIEKWFSNKVDFITVPVDSAVNAYYNEFKSKIKIIPQGFNFDNIQIYKGIINNLVPTFAYAGSFYKGKRDPALFLKFLNTLNFDFKFIVYTDDDSLIMPYKKQLKGKIQINPYIERKLLLYELSKSDFLVNIENIYTEQYPSKLIDYALTKRPILSIGTNQIDENKILDFFRGDYKDQLIIDIEKYDIKDIAKQFVNLIT